MQEVSMFEAKTQLSKLVKLANQGEEGVTTSGRARKPVARIVPGSRSRKKAGSRNVQRRFRTRPGVFRAFA